jgi:hypothetical protein
MAAAVLGGRQSGRLYAVGDILEAKLIAKKGIWRGFKVLNPTRQNLNDKQGGRTRSQMSPEHEQRDFVSS